MRSARCAGGDSDGDAGSGRRLARAVRDGRVSERLRSRRVVADDDRSLTLGDAGVHIVKEHAIPRHRRIGASCCR